MEEALTMTQPEAWPKGSQCAATEPHASHPWGWQSASLERPAGPKTCDGVPEEDGRRSSLPLNPQERRKAIDARKYKARVQREREVAAEEMERSMAGIENLPSDWWLS